MSKHHAVGRLLSSRRIHLGAAAFAGALAALLVAVNVHSQASVPCSDPGWPGELFCFDPNTPAKANEINGNFKYVNDFMKDRVIPVGSIVMWSGSTGSIPAGWVLCDGQNSTPDLRNRFVVGAGSGYAVAATGGADNVTLTTAQMPSHDHWLTTDQRSYYLFGGDNGSLIDYGDSGGNIHDLPRHYRSHTQVAGGGGSHENRPPYYALAFIMRI